MDYSDTTKCIFDNLMNLSTKYGIIQSKKIKIFKFILKNFKIQNPVWISPQNWKIQTGKNIILKKERKNWWLLSKFTNLKENKPVPVAQVDWMTTCKACHDHPCIPKPIPTSFWPLPTFTLIGFMTSRKNLVVVVDG